MNSKKKMVIHCASGINNSGDEAILGVLIDRYSDEYDISVISLNEKKSRISHQQVDIYENGTKACDNLVKECDVFILGGGGLLQDETTIFNLFRWLKYLKKAIKYKKFTMLYANSIGPLNYSISRKCVASVLQKVNLITLRDELSKKVLEDIGITENVYTTSDPVFSVDFYFDEKRFEGIKEKYLLPEKYVCIAIRHWYDTIPFIPVSICSKLGLRRKQDIYKYERYVDSLVEIVNYLNESMELPVVFVSFLVDRDDKVAFDILKKVKSKNNVCINDVELNCQDILHIFSKSKLLIGMRLHSLIYAIKCLKPFVGISYSAKVEGILKKYDLQDYMTCVDTFDLNCFCEIYNGIDFEQFEKKLQQVSVVAEKEEQLNERLFRKYYEESKQ